MSPEICSIFHIGDVGKFAGVGIFTKLLCLRKGSVIRNELCSSDLFGFNSSKVNCVDSQFFENAISVGRQMNGCADFVGEP